MGRRGVGRPALPLTSTTITPRPIQEGLTREERMSAAFQRKRDLNNLASRKWRRRRGEEGGQREEQERRSATCQAAGDHIHSTPPSTVHRPPSTVHCPPSTAHRPPATIHRRAFSWFFVFFNSLSDLDKVR